MVGGTLRPSPVFWGLECGVAVAGNEPQRFRSALSTVWRLLREPKAYIPILLNLAIPLWLSPGVYFSLWLYSIPLLSYIPPLLGVALLGFCAWSWLGTFADLLRRARKVRNARRRVVAGDLAAESDLAEARAEMKAAPIHIFIWGHLALNLAIPVFVAATLWGQLQKPEVRLVHGRLRSLSATEQLHRQLDHLRVRGIYTPFF